MLPILVHELEKMSEVQKHPLTTIPFGGLMLIRDIVKNIDTDGLISTETVIDGVGGG